LLKKAKQVKTAKKIQTLHLTKPNLLNNLPPKNQACRGKGEMPNFDS